MKVYLDTCSLQRPLDSREQPRNILEAEAVLLIIGLCETGHLEMVSSEALMFETQRTPNDFRREFALETLRKAKSFTVINATIKTRADELAANGVMPLDALHLACAEAAKVDFFCTCDDKLLKKAALLCEPDFLVVTPVQLLEKLP